MGSMLTILAKSDPALVKAFSEGLLLRMGNVRVERNRTGLVMLPMRESARGAQFLVGEVLMAEAEVCVDGMHGYGACLGRDVQHALAIAIIDAAHRHGTACADIDAFVAGQCAVQQQAEASLLQRVAMTRVEMETF